MKIEHWFTGIVENIADPLNSGRVQVRCYEYHELNDVTSIPSEKLPWATPLLPITSASSSSVGTGATGLMVGSWVFGFFRDSDQQDPVIIASIPGTGSTGADIPTDATSSSQGSAYANATNTAQYMSDSPIGGRADTSSLDPEKETKEAADNSKKVKSFADRIRSQTVSEE